MTSRTLLALAASLCIPLTAQSHVTLEQGEAATGSAYKAVMRIGHGCDGSPTREVSVLIPQGLRGAKPQPKAGWTLRVDKAPLAEPYDSHGKTITEDVVRVTWTARSAEDMLPDAFYDEFMVRGQLVALPGALWFKIEQRCQVGEWRWVETPPEGTSTRGLKAPAALLKVLPKADVAGVR